MAATSSTTASFSSDDPEMIDVDALQVVGNPEIDLELTQKWICRGIHVPLLPGQTPYSCYPFMLHDHRRLPWDVHIIKNKLWVQSSHCQGLRPDKTGDACRDCQAVLSSAALEGIMKRMREGIHENTPHMYWPIGGLLQIIRRKTEANDAMRFVNLNAMRKLLVAGQELGEHKQFLMAMAESKVLQLDALI